MENVALRDCDNSRHNKFLDHCSILFVNEALGVLLSKIPTQHHSSSLTALAITDLPENSLISLRTPTISFTERKAFSRTYGDIALTVHILYQCIAQCRYL